MTPKLILYSDQIQGRSDAVDDALLALVPASARIAFVPAASDSRQRYFKRACEHYSWLGLAEPEECDLESGCDPARIAQLWRCDAIHLGSGDPLHFAAFLNAKNLMAPLRRFVQAGGVLIGVSAGAMLLGDVVVDPAIEAPKSGAKAPRPMKGMGVFAPLFYPHFDGDAASVALLTRFARTQKRAVLACHDSEGVVVQGEDVELIGEVTRFEP